jgi:hypothetical protein
MSHSYDTIQGLSFVMQYSQEARGGSAPLLSAIERCIRERFIHPCRITRILEYAPSVLEQGDHGDKWGWVDRCFQVHFIVYDSFEPGHSIESTMLIALPKQQLCEIEARLGGDPEPKRVYRPMVEASGA